MGWNLLDPTITLDGTARTFTIIARLPGPLAAAQQLAEERGMTATEVWRGYHIGVPEAWPDHMMVVRSAQFEAPDRLTLRGAIEGPR